MKSRKRIFRVIALMLCFVMCVAIVGCQSKKEQSPPPAEASNSAESSASSSASSSAASDSDEALELKVIIMTSVPEIEYNTLYRACETYKEAHPNISFDYNVISTSGSTYEEKVLTMMAGGDTTDLFQPRHLPHYFNLISNGYVEELTPWIESSDLDMSVFRGTDESLRYDGKLYALPFTNDVWIVYYNKDMFDEAGLDYPDGSWTWEEYADYCAKLTHGEGADKVYGGYFQDWKASACNPAICDGLHDLSSYDDYEWLKYGYQYVYDLQKAGHIMDFSMISTNSLNYDSVFANKQVAMVYMGTWNNSRLNALADQIDFEWGICQAPHIAATGKQGDAVGTVIGCSMNANGEHKEEAFDVLKWVTSSPEASKAIASAGALPAVRDEETYQVLSEQVAGFPEGGEAAFEFNNFSLEMPLDPNSSMIEELTLQYYSLIMTDSISVDEGVEELAAEINALPH